MGACELHRVGQVMETVGKRLRSRRRLLGLSQVKLAETCGVTFQQIQKYETGAVAISASRLWRLSTALDVSIGYFFEGVSSFSDELLALSEDLY